MVNDVLGMHDNKVSLALVAVLSEDMRQAVLGHQDHFFLQHICVARQRLFGVRVTCSAGTTTGGLSRVKCAPSTPRPLSAVAHAAAGALSRVKCAPSTPHPLSVVAHAARQPVLQATHVASTALHETSQLSAGTRLARQPPPSRRRRESHHGRQRRRRPGPGLHPKGSRCSSRTQPAEARGGQACGHLQRLEQEGGAVVHAVGGAAGAADGSGAAARTAA